MKMNPTLVLLSAAIWLLASGAALAQPAQPDVKTQVNEALNGLSLLDKVEVLEYARLMEKNIQDELIRLLENLPAEQREQVLRYAREKSGKKAEEAPATPQDKPAQPEAPKTTPTEDKAAKPGSTPSSATAQPSTATAQANKPVTAQPSNQPSTTAAQTNKPATAQPDAETLTAKGPAEASDTRLSAEESQQFNADEKEMIEELLVEAAEEMQPAQNIAIPTNSLGEPLYTTAELDTDFHDFGKVPEGQKVYHTFRITNTGPIPLNITHAKASCGCTVPTVPDKPIGKGETADITVEFDSTNKRGEVTQAVIVYNNTVNRRSIIRIRGEVVPMGEASGSSAP